MALFPLHLLVVVSAAFLAYSGAVKKMQLHSVPAGAIFKHRMTDKFKNLLKVFKGFEFLWMVVKASMRVRI